MEIFGQDSLEDLDLWWRLHGRPQDGTHAQLLGSCDMVPPFATSKKLLVGTFVGSNNVGLMSDLDWESSQDSLT